ncbi:MAG: KpsF/GutQ family sugar-phosphate isomerase [Candidatus Omnitrophica bacterium]|nr:KpsF/GutQ family sugar-phosphate isomerase [Candidatus Omnitrophota bacterium]
MIIKRAKGVLTIERDAINSLIGRIDAGFKRTVEAIYKTKGRVVVTGMGKPGFIAQKITATLSSLGTPSLYLHAADALHGDIGKVTKDDIIIVLSNSGETEEVVKLLPIIKKIGAKLIAMTGNTRSTLAKNSDFVLDVSVKKEACSLGLAPTASTTAMLAMGDALAIALLDRRGFKETDFALYHPGGILGKKLLLKVEDIMRKGEANPLVGANMLVKDVLLRITNARSGSACVIDKNKKLIGIFTDGDLRRHLEKDPHIITRKVKDVMTKTPTAIRKQRLAAEALSILRSKKIDEIPVVDEKGRPIGLVDVQDLLKAGLV